MLYQVSGIPGPLRPFRFHTNTTAHQPQRTPTRSGLSSPLPDEETEAEAGVSTCVQPAQEAGGQREAPSSVGFQRGSHVPPPPPCPCGLEEVDPITANNTKDKDDRHILTLRDLFLSSFRASVARLGLGLHGGSHP